MYVRMFSARKLDQFHRFVSLFAPCDKYLQRFELERIELAAGSRCYTNFTDGEFFDGVVLALDIFTVESYGSGSKTAQPCVRI